MPKYSFYKIGNKAEAKEYAAQLRKKGKKYRIEKQPGTKSVYAVYEYRE